MQNPPFGDALNKFVQTVNVAQQVSGLTGGSSLGLGLDICFSLGLVSFSILVFVLAWCAVTCVHAVKYRADLLHPLHLAITFDPNGEGTDPECRRRGRR